MLSCKYKNNLFFWCFKNVIKAGQLLGKHRHNPRSIPPGKKYNMNHLNNPSQMYTSNYFSFLNFWREALLWWIMTFILGIISLVRTLVNFIVDKSEIYTYELLSYFQVFKYIPVLHLSISATDRSHGSALRNKLSIRIGVRRVSLFLESIFCT